MMRFAAFSTACLLLAAPAMTGAAAASTAEDSVSTRGPRLDAWLRGSEPKTTGSVQATNTTPAKPSCPPERRVGTGAGFCMIN